MPITSLNEVLPQARKEQRAIGAFNIANFETAKAVILAAEAEDSPVIMQIYQRLMQDPHVAGLAAMMRQLAEDASVQVVVHLDHGASFEQAKHAIDLGFSSVMFDGSFLAFDENIETTRKVVAYAHQHGVSVEGEIGQIPANANGVKTETLLSTPNEAISFYEATKVDALAVAVGTAHGFYESEPKIDLELVDAIGKAIPVPLVLHGGSGTPVDTIRASISRGFAKVNVATEFQHSYQQRVSKDLNALNGEFMPVDKWMADATADAVECLRRYIRLFNGDTSI